MAAKGNGLTSRLKLGIVSNRLRVKLGNVFFLTF